MQLIDITPGVKVYQEDNFSILFGSPPEVIKHLMIRKIPFPDYVVLPDTVQYRGVLQNATEFVLYYHLFVLQNFFKGKKLKILGEARHIINNRDLLRLSLHGPTLEEYQALDDSPQKNPYFEGLFKESRALSLKDKSDKEIPIDGFVDFFSFKNGEIETGDFRLYHRERNKYEVNKTLIDVNFAEDQIPPYDLNPNSIPLMPSKFGIDVLGGASGFAANNPCSGLILNYNSQYMLIDCVPYLEHSLKARGISRNQISSIFLSHIHDDHCNLFPLVLFHKRIKFLCTKEIFWMACKKLSLMTMHSVEDFYSYFEFVELKPYQANDFYGLTIIPHYTVHSIPTIGAIFQMNCDGHIRSIVFVGDNKSLPKIKELVDSGVVKPEKYQEIYKLYHDKYDITFADGGKGILHGDPKDSLESKSNRVCFLHLEELPQEFNTTFTLASHGKRFTIKEGDNQAYILKTMHILNTQYSGISEAWLNTLLNNLTLIKYNTGDVIIKQNEISNGNIYIILTGNVKILFHDGKQSKKIAMNQAGDLMGEMAIINNVKIRSASVVAGTPVVLSEIDGVLFYSFLRSEGRVEYLQEMLKKRKMLEPCFRNFGFSVSLTQKLANVGELVPVKKGQEIIKQGVMGRKFYIILKGRFTVIKNDKEIAVLGVREFFGEYGSLEQHLRSSTVKALEDAEVLQLDKDDIINIAESTPSLNFYLNELMVDRGEKVLGQN